MHRLTYKNALLISISFVTVVLLSTVLYQTFTYKPDISKEAVIETCEYRIIGATPDEFKSYTITKIEVETVGIKSTEISSENYIEPHIDKEFSNVGYNACCELPESYYENKHLLACVIYLEAGSCSEYCQWLVGSAVMNLADDRGGLSIVAYDVDAINVAPKIDNCSPSQTSLSIAERILAGDRDYNVKSFRMSYYHNFGTPYTNIDNVYFSTF